MIHDTTEWPEDKWALCLRLKRRGLKVPEIAKEMGITTSALYGKLWRKGISAAPGVKELELPPGARTRRIRPGRSTLPPLASLESTDAQS